MKKILILLCVIIVLMCSSCEPDGHRRYVCDRFEVESIQIIRLDECKEEALAFEYTVLVEIDDIETFVNRLNQVENCCYWDEPSTLKAQYIVIKIDYDNGDYDYLHQNAQLFNRSGITKPGSFYYYDEQFNSLVSDYLNE